MHQNVRFPQFVDVRHKHVLTFVPTAKFVALIGAGLFKLLIPIFAEQVTLPPLLKQPPPCAGLMLKPPSLQVSHPGTPFGNCTRKS